MICAQAARGQKLPIKQAAKTSGKRPFQISNCVVPQHVRDRCYSTSGQLFAATHLLRKWAYLPLRATRWVIATRQTLLGGLPARFPCAFRVDNQGAPKLRWQFP